MAEEKEVPAEKPKDTLVFNLTGKVEYQLELAPDQFKYRSQVSSENNLANILAIRELTASIVARQKLPTLPKAEKLDKHEMTALKNANWLMSMYAERLAALLYDQAVQKQLQPDKPNIEIAQPTAGLRKV